MTPVSQPHLGNLINAYLVQQRITRAQCARWMDVTPTEVTKYLQRPSLQFHVLWNFCIALQHDFFGDIAATLPEHFPRKEDPRIAEMQNKLDIYKELLTSR